MIKILNIIGARPQIIKAAAISRAIKNHFQNEMEDVVLHTGQHYDDNMSQIFINELQVSKPKYNLGIGSGSHGKQTASMISGLEEIILKERPDYVFAYGDTNSTLAVSIAASKIKIPIVHIEAGLRSFNKNMPEEINRIMCDHVSTLLFSPTKTGIHNLKNEGFKVESKGPYSFNNPGVFHSGDVMYDNTVYFSKVAEQNSKILTKLKLERNNFILLTVHRDHNTDNPEKLHSIFNSIQEISTSFNVQFVIPLHPRTFKLLNLNISPDLNNKISKNSLIKIIEPVSFFDMIMLEKYSLMVFTDSGGVQKEAYFFEKPCIILRPETEWVELVESGMAIITDTNETKIKEGFQHFINSSALVFPSIFGNAKASEFICKKILENS